MQYIQYIVIALVMFIIALAIIKGSKKDFHIEANKLVEYLGGKDNILGVEVNMSRFKVTLKDVSIVNKEAIQRLGARGIVEVDNQLKIILGLQAQKLKKYIEDLKKATSAH
ncbi:MAG: PTS transporter subunit EIIB [Bacilli bacterium]|nr:PTS transporter subunit EIIB [Bacilli bacterium]